MIDELSLKYRNDFIEKYSQRKTEKREKKKKSKQ